MKKDYFIKKERGFFKCYEGNETLGKFGRVNNAEPIIFDTYEDASAFVTKVLEDDQVWVITPASKSKKAK